MIAHLWRRMLCEVLDSHRLERCQGRPDHEWTWDGDSRGGEWKAVVRRRKSRRDRGRGDRA